VQSEVELAACQVHVTAEDYASEAHFVRMLDRIGARLSAARARRGGEYAYPCLAVFPEMIGTFLPLAGRLAQVEGARTTDEALTRVGLSSLGRMASAMLRGRTASPKVGFLLSAARDVRRIYRDAFARFARKYGCWTVAGSAILPKNAHDDLEDAFEPADGRVYNTSYVFDPEGRHVGAVRKVNLVPTVEDALGLTPEHSSELSAVSTPFGGVGTLICYDGFAVAHTPREPRFRALLSHYDELGCRVVAQPAANFWPWEEPWTFAGAAGGLVRKEQWHGEGLFAQMGTSPLSAVRYGVTAQLLGRVFDNRFDGRSHILARDASGVRAIAEAVRADASPEAEEVVLARVSV
jgi:predicted amidohydrolase